MQRRMKLADVIAARKTWPTRASWAAIFIKAYSLTAVECPELRRSYIPFPWPHIYEHATTIASFSVEREYRDEPGVFFAQINEPNKFLLADLSTLVRSFKTEDVHSVPSFRRALWLAKLPRPLRRAVWWWGLNAFGMERSRYFGTFGLSSNATNGAASLHILTPLTTALNYGVFEPDGSLDVRVAYDHRVFDGVAMARALSLLEETLNGAICAELKSGQT